MKKFPIVIASLIILLSLSACSSSETNYFNQKFKYHNLEIIITAVDENIQSNGNYLTTISFSATNTGKYEYDFYLKKIYVKNVETDSKHDCMTTLLDSFVQESIDSGLTKNYNVKFTLPTSIAEDKYIMYFDFGSFGSPAGKCALYYENGDMIRVSNSKQEYLNEVKRMQSDIYNIMKQSIYDKLDGSMSYSFVQNSMDNAERQIKTKIPTFDISLDISSGTMFPKWICSVRLNDGKIYLLMYISVDLNSSYHLSHKYIGTYNIG